MRFWCNFLGKNSVSAYIYAFCMFNLPHHINVAQGGHNLTWFRINQFPPIDIYFCQSGIFNWSFDPSIFKACDTFRTSGRSTPVTCPTAPLLPEYNLRTFEKSLLKSKETTLWPGWPWPGWTGWRCWRSEQELLRNLLKSKETTLWLQKQKTLMPSIR